MTCYSLSRTNGPALSFEGELITATRGPADDQGRRYVVAIYRSHDGGFVVEVRFWHAAEAAPAVVAEFVEQPEDVEKVLYVFEPLEQLPAERLKKLSAESRQVLINQLFKLYDKEVASALKEFGQATKAESASRESSTTAFPGRR